MVGVGIRGLRSRWGVSGVLLDLELGERVGELGIHWDGGRGAEWLCCPNGESRGGKNPVLGRIGHMRLSAVLPVFCPDARAPQSCRYEFLYKRLPTPEARHPCLIPAACFVLPPSAFSLTFSLTRLHPSTLPRPSLAPTLSLMPGLPRARSPTTTATSLFQVLSGSSTPTTPD